MTPYLCLEIFEPVLFNFDLKKQKLSPLGLSLADKLSVVKKLRKPARTDNDADADADADGRNRVTSIPCRLSYKTQLDEK